MLWCWPIESLKKNHNSAQLVHKEPIFFNLKTIIDMVKTKGGYVNHKQNNLLIQKKKSR